MSDINDLIHTNARIAFEQGAKSERERIVDVLWDSIGEDRDAPGWRWKRELIRSLISAIELRGKCLVHTEGKWDAGCSCKKGIAERVKKV